MLANVVENLAGTGFGEKDVYGFVGRVRWLFEVFFHLKQQRQFENGNIAETRSKINNGELTRLLTDSTLELIGVIR